MARTSVINVGKKWAGPPFPALSNGFLLGSDRAGRRYLQPAFVGSAADPLPRHHHCRRAAAAWPRHPGWRRATEPVGANVASVATRLALAVPVLVVALATITLMVSAQPAAFLLGLSLTGWAETARYVETQARDPPAAIYGGGAQHGEPQRTR
ncbi:MAG: hypothetical protein U0X20_18630 [Caldilineaceae bacterium]